MVIYNEDWIKEWQSDILELDQEMIDWIRSRPACIQSLMVEFPPHCLVKANRSLMCPAPGTVGIVFSYLENGLLTVVQSPDSDLRAQCESDWLEVVGYHGGLTPEKVKAVIRNEIPF